MKNYTELAKSFVELYGDEIMDLNLSKDKIEDCAHEWFYSFNAGFDREDFESLVSAIWNIL